MFCHISASIVFGFQACLNVNNAVYFTIYYSFGSGWVSTDLFYEISKKCVDVVVAVLIIIIIIVLVFKHIFVTLEQNYNLDMSGLGCVPFDIVIYIF